MTCADFEALVKRLHDEDDWATERNLRHADLIRDAANALESLRPKPMAGEMPYQPAILREWRSRGSISIEMGEILSYIDELLHCLATLPRERKEMVPSARALGIARQTVDEAVGRAVVKVKLAMAGMPMHADIIDAMAVLAYEIIRLSAHDERKE